MSRGQPEARAQAGQTNGQQGSGASADICPQFRLLSRVQIMTRPATRDAIYRGRVFDAEIIELCVLWYIAYRLSYRDLVAMMTERGVEVSHITVLRWVMKSRRLAENREYYDFQESTGPGRNRYR